MAETTNQTDHARSINPTPNSMPLLNGGRYGNRYGFKSNQPYTYPEDLYTKTVPGDTNFLKIVQWFVRDHYENQLPRILELKRYYIGDTNIHYWASFKKNRADNRIASAMARYITNINVGYQFYNPISYGYENVSDEDDTGEDILAAIQDFNQASNERYHDMQLGKNLDICGRAYELLYIEAGTNTPKVASVDPATAFVVWSTDIEPKPLFGVRYYSANIQDTIQYAIDVYTDTDILHYQTDSDPQSDWNFIDSEGHNFDSMPLNEFSRNEERIGLFEPDLDKLDAYDQAISEMTNSQEDFSNASLVINGELSKTSGRKTAMLDSVTGKPVYMDAEGHQTINAIDPDTNRPNAPIMLEKTLDTKSNVFYIKPYVFKQPDKTTVVSQTSMSYLTKGMDLSSWKVYLDQLMHDIHKDTNTPDVTDENFAANASGVAMSYKLWGSDQETATSEALFSDGLTRRLKIVADYWNKLPGNGIKFDANNNPIDFITTNFTPHLPKNDQETMTTVQALRQTGASDETIFEMMQAVTGVSADTEMQRLDDQKQANSEIAASFGQVSGSNGNEPGASDKDDPDKDDPDKDNPNDPNSGDD